MTGEPVEHLANGQLYERIRVLGTGSFGAAVVHRRRLDKALVVLKEIDLKRFRGNCERQAALREAQIMSTLKHANIINYYNAYTTDTKLIIEMEYASLGSLAAYLSLSGCSGGSHLLELDEIWLIFHQLASGLEYLHSKNIVHLDLKMANIFVTGEGLVKIGDFGISQHLSNADLQQKQQHRHHRATQSTEQVATDQLHLGTLAYSSPERCLGEPTDFKSDIWSLGCVLYELITGQPLFAGDSLAELVLRITRIQYEPIRRPLDPLIASAFELTIARQPQQRPTAAELAKLSSTGLLSGRQSQEQLKAEPVDRFQATGGSFLQRSRPAGFRQAARGGAQVRCPHSLVYQVSLDGRHVRVDRVDLPQSKRIRTMAKGGSHYLALTYDHIVYAWGSRSHGQLGACGLTSSSSSSNPLRVCSSARGSICVGVSGTSSGANSLTASTQTLATDLPAISFSRQSAPVGQAKQSIQQLQPPRRQQQPHLSRQLVVSMLRESPPTSKPFVVLELNHRRIVQVAAGRNFSVFLSKTGIVMTCGDGSRGCLGRGDLSSSFTPSMVENLLNRDVVSIACGPAHVVAVCGDGHAFAWGNSRNGRLGVDLSSGLPDDARYISRPRLVQFPAGVQVRRAICGDKCTLFIDTTNKCWATGENKSNRLGLDIQRRFKQSLRLQRTWRPREIRPLAKQQIVTANIGKRHASFITDERKLLLFGQHIERPGDSRAAKSSRMPLIAQTLSRCKQLSGLLRKSPNCRKMTFEGVSSVTCGSKFTLALTQDNRVYFWGTRSHSDSLLAPASSSSLEPQLVASETDECFVKIGATNSSLMSDIQTLGSDQPILHAQDPKLVVDSLSDLWILDYASGASGTTSGSSNSSSVSGVSCNDSTCSCCSVTNQSHLDNCSYCSECSSNWTNIRHDAILNPQPIVSLYVPPMFGQSGSALHLSDLFCFDDDRFYLIADTTVKLAQPSWLRSAQPGALNRNRSLQTDRLPTLSQQPQPPQHQLQQHQRTSQHTNPELAELPATTEQTPNENQQAFDQLAQPSNDQQSERPLKVSAKVAREPLAELEFEQQSESSELTIKHSRCSLEELENNDQLDELNNNSGFNRNAAASLEEPRSLSTFGVSLSAQVVMGPSMRNENAQLCPLTFAGDRRSCQWSHLSSSSCSPSSASSLTECLRMLPVEQQQMSQPDDTGSMPSWVRNEFILQQQMELKRSSAIDTSDRSSNSTLVSDRFDLNRARPNGLAGLHLSRSEPQIASMDATQHSVVSAERVQQDRLAAGSANLLECGIYRRRDRRSLTSLRSRGLSLTASREFHARDSRAQLERHSSARGQLEDESIDDKLERLNGRSISRCGSGSSGSSSGGSSGSSRSSESERGTRKTYQRANRELSQSTQLIYGEREKRQSAKMASSLSLASLRKSLLRLFC